MTSFDYQGHRSLVIFRIVIFLVLVGNALSIDVCEANATMGYRWTGRVLGFLGPLQQPDVNSWTPVAGIGYKEGSKEDMTWSHYAIPSELQGLQADSPAQCNCRCAATDVCIAYTWLGGSSRTCWLHSYALLYDYGITSDRYLLPDTSILVPVPNDTIVGRVVKGPKEVLPLCPVVVTFPKNKFLEPSSDRINQQPDSVTGKDPSYCLRACELEPYCIGFYLPPAQQGVEQVCRLISNASGLVEAETDTEYAAALQVCSDDLPLPPPAPPLAPGTINGVAFCNADVAPGVRFQGLAFPEFNASFSAEMTTLPASLTARNASLPTPVYSNKYIPPDLQALDASTANECNCRCLSVLSCAGFTWLGSRFKTCWLHSSIFFFDVEGSRVYTDPRYPGSTAMVFSDTVVARVVGDRTWDSCDIGDAPEPFNDALPSSISTDGIPDSVQNQTMTSPSRCMVECWKHPKCIGFLWTGIEAEPGKCTLLSDAKGINISSGYERTVEAKITSLYNLQVCSKYLVDTSQQGPPLAVRDASPGLIPAQISESPGRNSKTVVVGAAVGGVCGGVIILAIAMFVFLKKKRRACRSTATTSLISDGKPGSGSLPLVDCVATNIADISTSCSMAAAHQVALGDKGGVCMEIPNLTPGEAFTRATAFAYSWTDEEPHDAVPVEAYVNDTQLDSQRERNSNKHQHAVSDVSSPVVELTSDEMRNSVKLIKTGLIGRGASALVFKCIWPERFGNGLLAAKVMKDSYELDIYQLQSFAHEADVLSCCLHPNVVRMYGYVLEPPVVCLILELLPLSMKDLLYKELPGCGNISEQRHLLTKMICGCPSDSLPSSSALDSLKYDNICTNISSSSTQRLLTSNQSTKPSHLHRLNTQPTRSCVKPSWIVETVRKEEQERGDVDGKSSMRRTTGDDRSGPQGIVHSRAVEDADVDADADGCAVKSYTMKVKADTTSDPASKDADESSLTVILGDGSSSAHGPTCCNPLTMFEVLHLAKDVAAGLTFLHDRDLHGTNQERVLQAVSRRTRDQVPLVGMKIVHRDLKPANILINSRGVAKISDFGLARAHKNTTIHTGRLGAGTLSYMAPELLIGRTSQFQMTATNRVDVYSFAIMLWELLNRRQPWTNMNEVNIMASVINHRRPPLPHTLTKSDGSSHLADLHVMDASPDALPELNDLIKTMWHHRESRRPTANEVLLALTDLLNRHTYAVNPGKGN